MKKSERIKDKNTQHLPAEKTNKIIDSIESILQKNVGDNFRVLKIKKHLIVYVDLLCEWQNVHNVVSSKYGKYEIWENILDSIIFLRDSESIISLQFIGKKYITDAGAGNGFPGIPLAIIFDEINFSLVDIDRKKCSFLRMVKAQLALKNVVVINSDITKIKSTDFIITKAAFSPPHVPMMTRPLAEGGRIVIWGKSVEAFARALKPFGVIFTCKYDYSLPSGKQRSLLCFEKKGF